MTDLDLYGRPAGRLATSLQLWAEEASAAEGIAHQLAGTPFVPASLRVFTHGHPDIGATTANIAAALLAGQELGLEPMAALRSIDVVNGTPALRALALVAVAQAAGHQIWQVESTATRAIFRGRRAGDPPEQIQEVVWTLDRARALGLAGKDNWRKQPTAMLAARAKAEIARLVAADAILGLAYSAEELDDGPGDDITVEQVPDAPKRTAKRRTSPAAALTAKPAPDEPTLAAEPAQPPTAPPPADEPPMQRTEAQSRRLHATLRDLGITDRAAGLAMIGDILGHPVDSTSDLTVSEAAQVIDDLDRRRIIDEPAPPDVPAAAEPPAPQPAPPEPGRPTIEVTAAIASLTRKLGGNVPDLLTPLVGRPIDRTGQLTIQEADRVLEALQARYDRERQPIVVDDEVFEYDPADDGRHDDRP